MPLRTCTHKDGHTTTMMIRSIHPDGTEFLPEEFTVPRSEVTGIAYKILEYCLDSKAICDAAEAEETTV